MRIAIISDIHGNNVAFEAVLADLQNDTYDQLVCLGDAIQGGPQPAEVVANLRRLTCPVVMGNADAWMLTGIETADEGIPPERLKKMGEIREWSLSKLTEDDKAFIAAFKPTAELPLATEQNLLCFHGSPASFDDIILPTTSDEDFRKYLGAYAPHLLTGGHTHMQQIRRLEGAANSFFFNPGSVGLAYSHYQPSGNFKVDKWAEYALLTANNGRIALEFRRVPFDVDTLISIYQSSGRPHAEDSIGQYQS